MHSLQAAKFNFCDEAKRSSCSLSNWLSCIVDFVHSQMYRVITVSVRQSPEHIETLWKHRMHGTTVCMDLQHARYYSMNGTRVWTVLQYARYHSVHGTTVCMVLQCMVLGPRAKTESKLLSEQLAFHSFRHHLLDTQPNVSCRCTAESTTDTDRHKLCDSTACRHNSMHGVRYLDEALHMNSRSRRDEVAGFLASFNAARGNINISCITTAMQCADL